MEILKKSAVVILYISLFIGFSAIGQDFQETRQAFELSYDYEAEGNYTKAIDALKNVYSAESYETNVRLGWLSYMSGNFTESVAYYQKSIALKPYAFEARFGLVYPAAAAGNWNLVTEQYQNILEADPANTLALYRMGMIKYGIQDYEAASIYFQKVVDLYPFDYDALIMYAWSKYFLGQLKDAKVLFQKVLLVSPDDASALEGLDLIK